METTDITQGQRSPRQYSAEDRERLIKEQAQSGLTKKAFCEQRGINIGTFHGWGKRRGERETTSAIVPQFAEVEVTPGMQAAVEVLLPNGVRVGIRHQGKRDELVALVRGVAGC